MGARGAGGEQGQAKAFPHEPASPRVPRRRPMTPITRRCRSWLRTRKSRWRPRDQRRAHRYGGPARYHRAENCRTRLPGGVRSAHRSALRADRSALTARCRCGGARCRSGRSRGERGWCSDVSLDWHVGRSWCDSDRHFSREQRSAAAWPATPSVWVTPAGCAAQSLKAAIRHAVTRESAERKRGDSSNHFGRYQLSERFVGHNKKVVSDHSPRVISLAAAHWEANFFRAYEWMDGIAARDLLFNLRPFAGVSLPGMRISSR